MLEARMIWTYALARFFAVPKEERERGDGILIWVIVIAALAIAAIAIVAIIVNTATTKARTVKTQ
jgi:hypothetical protein